MNYDLFGVTASAPSVPPSNGDNSAAVRRGKAAEAFVGFRLLNWGHDANGTLPYEAADLIVSIGQGAFARVQVKGCEKPLNGWWNFNFRQGNPRTGNGSRPYPKDAFDIAACVALGLQRVIFVAGVPKRIPLRTADFKRPGYEFESWRCALESIQRKPRH